MSYETFNLFNYYPVKSENHLVRARGLFNLGIFYFIARVLDFGDEKDLKTLREIYADKKLIGVVRKRKGLLSMTRRFWSVYFNITLPGLKDDRGCASTESL